MKIKYVGVKPDGETAFARESGVARWMPGSSHEVPDHVGVKMLRHPDVFARDDAKGSKAPVAAPAEGDEWRPTSPTDKTGPWMTALSPAHCFA